jgi:hypothetical protein
VAGRRPARLLRRVPFHFPHRLRVPGRGQLLDHRGCKRRHLDRSGNRRVPVHPQPCAGDTRVVNQQETLAAREAQQKLKDAFSEWIWRDEERAGRLARYYNDTFNNLRLRAYDGSHLTFPGMNRSMLRREDLDKHQKDAVWRILQNDNTLLAHCVGAGIMPPAGLCREDSRSYYWCGTAVETRGITRSVTRTIVWQREADESLFRSVPSCARVTFTQTR